MDAIILNGFSLEVLNEYGPIEKVVHGTSNYYSLPHNTEYKLRLSNNHHRRVDAHVWIDGEKVGIWRINPTSRITIERPSTIARKFTLLKEGSGVANSIGISKGNPDNGLIRVTFRPEKESGYTFVKQAMSVQDPHPYLKRKCFDDYTDGVTPHTNQNRRCQLYNADYNNYTTWSAEQAERALTGQPRGSNSSLSSNTPNRSPDMEYSCNATSGFDSLTTDRYDKQLSAGATGLGDHSGQRFQNTTSLGEIDLANVTTIYTRLIIDNDNSAYRRPFIPLKTATISNRAPPPINIDNPSRPRSCSTDSAYTRSKMYYFDNF